MSDNPSPSHVALRAKEAHVADVRELAEKAEYFENKDGIKMRMDAVAMNHMRVEDPEGQSGDTLKVYYADVDLLTDKFWGLCQIGHNLPPKAIIVTGNVVDGLTFTGPYDTKEDALRDIDTDIDDTSVVAMLVNPTPEE